MNSLYFASSVAIIALITWLTRALPFLIFGNKKIPTTARYLGNVLPPAIMVILVFYCLRNLDFSNLSNFSGYLPEVLSGALVIIVHRLKKNMYLSIITGTLCYMILIRLFPGI